MARLKTYNMMTPLSSTIRGLSLEIPYGSALKDDRRVVVSPKMIPMQNHLEVADATVRAFVRFCEYILRTERTQYKNDYARNAFISRYHDTLFIMEDAQATSDTFLPPHRDDLVTVVLYFDRHYFSDTIRDEKLSFMSAKTASSP